MVNDDTYNYIVRQNILSKSVALNQTTLHKDGNDS